MQVISTTRRRPGNEIDPLPLHFLLPIVGNMNASMCSRIVQLYFDAVVHTTKLHKGDGFASLLSALSVVYMAGRIEAIRAIRAERRS